MVTEAVLRNRNYLLRFRVRFRLLTSWFRFRIFIGFMAGKSELCRFSYTANLDFSTLPQCTPYYTMPCLLYYHCITAFCNIKIFFIIFARSLEESALEAEHNRSKEIALVEFHARYRYRICFPLKLWNLDPKWSFRILPVSASDSALKQNTTK